jgi:phosphoglycerate kinase
MTAIVGGSKVSSKIEVLENLLGSCDELIIGGGMANTFVKAMGGSTGRALVEEDLLDTARADHQEGQGERASSCTSPPMPWWPMPSPRTPTPTNAPPMPCPMDGWPWTSAPRASKAFRIAILGSKTILWNGPMGVFEMKPFQQGTIAIANAVAEATGKGRSRW